MKFEEVLKKVNEVNSELLEEGIVNKEYSLVIVCDEILSDKFSELDLGEWVSVYDSECDFDEYCKMLNDEVEILSEECYSEDDEDFREWKKFCEEVKKEMGEYLERL